MPNSAPPWKTLAWNGVSLDVPPDWDPVELEAHSLRATGTGGLFLELKWERGTRGFDARKRLDKVGGEIAAGATHAEVPLQITAAAEVLENTKIETKTFAWTASGKQQAAGLILHCPQAHTAALAQVVFPESMPPSWGAAARLLAGIRFHGTDGHVPWAAYGIKALVPGELRLSSYSFHPGHFRLRFAGRSRRGATELILDRLGPADVLLGNTALHTYTDKLYGGCGAEPGFFVPGPGPSAASGQAQPRPGLLARLKRNGAYRALKGKAWLPGDNKILAVYMRGRSPDTLDCFDSICEAYALDNQETN
ncbi:hypothetical protein [Desulfovibrio ferrophilus]|uniref:Uncharacterized protein n=1 Tax=Desulfovibrio ferrophilus TaxID=241368 RepID=A0A2Z6AY87_9BACT|nr:hypothetical protein [Desulfovibrio ferrophilus]BBD08188.1 uncharacterized protein DFE_1462 [Desulfovibrio ferrophilus]